MELKEIFPEIAKLTIKYEIIPAAGIGVRPSEHEKTMMPNDYFMDRILCPARCGRAVPLLDKVRYCAENRLTDYEFRYRCEGPYQSPDPRQVCGTGFIVQIHVAYL